MSKLFTLASFFIALTAINASAFEATDQRLYEALNIAEVNVTPDGILGASTYQKKVGSLNCERTQGVYPGAVSTYHCALTGDSRLDGRIYEALNVPEKNITPNRVLGSSRFRKRAGDFACTKEIGVYPGAIPEFSCGFLYEAPAPQSSSEEASSESAI